MDWSISQIWVLPAQTAKLFIIIIIIIIFAFFYSFYLLGDNSS